MPVRITKETLRGNHHFEKKKETPAIHHLRLHHPRKKNGEGGETEEGEEVGVEAEVEEVQGLTPAGEREVHGEAEEVAMPLIILHGHQLEEEVIGEEEDGV